MADLTQYLKDASAAQVEADLATLKNNYDNNVLSYEQQEAKIPQTYQDKNNTLAAEYAKARRNFDERAAASGLNTGTAGQAELSRSSQYINNLAKNNLQRQQELANIALAKQQLKNTYDANALSIQREADSALQTALYNELIRQENEAAAAAAAKSKSAGSDTGSDVVDGDNPSAGLTYLTAVNQDLSAGADPVEVVEKTGALYGSGLITEKEASSAVKAALKADTKNTVAPYANAYASSQAANNSRGITSGKTNGLTIASGANATKAAIASGNSLSKNSTAKTTTAKTTTAKTTTAKTTTAKTNNTKATNTNTGTKNTKAKTVTNIKAFGG